MIFFGILPHFSFAIQCRYHALRESIVAKRAVRVETGAKAEAARKASADADLFTPLQQMRARFLKRKRTHGDREEATLAALRGFKKEMRGVTAVVPQNAKKKMKSRSSRGAIGESVAEVGGAEGKGGKWMNHNLKFVRHFEDSLRHDASGLVTIDPEKYVSSFKRFLFDISL